MLLRPLASIPALSVATGTWVLSAVQPALALGLWIATVIGSNILWFLRPRLGRELTAAALLASVLWWAPLPALALVLACITGRGVLRRVRSQPAFTTRTTV